MTDPQRLLSEPHSVLDRTLLESVMSEQPSDSQRHRVRNALGIGTGIAITSALGRKAFAATATAKAAGAIMAIAALGGGLWWSQTRDSGTGVPPVSESATVTMNVSRDAPHAAAVTADDPAMVADKESVAVADEPLPESASLARPRARVSGNGRRSPDLGDQIRAIDVARTAVAKHDTKSALVALDGYESRFPGGAFEQEAAVLRIEAIDQNGDHERATSLARAFLAKNPTSPHVTRVRRILDATPRAATRNATEKQ